MVWQMSSSHYGDPSCILATGALTRLTGRTGISGMMFGKASRSKLSGQTLSWMPRGPWVGAWCPCFVPSRLHTPCLPCLPFPFLFKPRGFAHCTFTFLVLTMVRLSFFGAARNCTRYPLPLLPFMESFLMEMEKNGLK